MPITKITDRSEVSTTNTTTIYINAWKFIWKRPAALFGLIVIVLFIFISLFADVIAPYSLKDIHLGYADLPPVWVKESLSKLSGNPDFLLGTDTLGRDTLSWGLFGTRTSVLIGLISAPLIAIFGTMYGLISGFIGGKFDNVVMRIADVFYAFPTIMIYTIIVLALRNTAVGKMWSGILMLLIAILSVGWVGIARLVRSNVLVVRNLEYIEAAYAIGCKPLYIIFKHVLPNVLTTIIVWMTYSVPQIILIESILGYLGVGINGSDPYAFFGASWGGMFFLGRRVLYIQPIMTIFPAVGLALISLAFAFLGDAMRDAFDPRYQKVKKNVAD